MMSDLNKTIDELNVDITNINAEQDTQDQNITNMTQDISNLAGILS